jgi:hypothetical protein
MKTIRLSLLPMVALGLFALALSTGCGKKNDTSMQQNGTNGTNGSANNMPGMPGTANASNQANNLPAGPAIKSATLSNFLPELAGYTKSNPEHMDMNMSGMSWSSAKSTYTNGDNRVTINIFDYNHQAGLAAAYSMYTTGNLNVETDDEITRSQQIGGFPGWVNWKKKSNNGSVGVIVGDRIWVVIETSKAGSIDDLVAIAQKVDLAGLSKAS